MKLKPSLYLFFETKRHGLPYSVFAWTAQSNSFKRIINALCISISTYAGNPGFIKMNVIVKGYFYIFGGFTV